MDTLVVKIWPISITGSDKIGTGAAVLVVLNRSGLDVGSPTAIHLLKKPSTKRPGTTKSNT